MASLTTKVVLMTVRNLTSAAINVPIVGGNGVSADAVGGSKTNPLPYPFSNIPLAANSGAGAINYPTANADTVTLPVHLDDMRYQSVPWLPLEPSREWSILVQKGIVSISFAADSNTSTFPEDNLDANIVGA